jgi:4'-phosphopantetheinyl transferase
MFIDQSEIHLWSLPLQESPTDVGVFKSLLSEDEIARAMRYHRVGDAMRFVRSRVWLRKLVEGYTGIRAKDIAFSYGAYGKPELSSNVSCPDIHFSISHTSGLTLFAFALGEDVGVDIESTAQQIDVQAASAHFLGAAELAHLNSTSSDCRKSLFFKYWTRKEACLKLLGTGLSGEPETIDVSKPPTVWIKAVSSSEQQPGDKALWLTDLQLEGRYSGACALAGPMAPKVVRHFRCDHAAHTFAEAKVPR